MASNLFTFLSKNKLSTVLLGFCLFVLPFQLKVLSYETAWGQGFLNPYTSIYFTIFDAALLAAAALFLYTKRVSFKASKTLAGLLLFLALALLSLFFGSHTDSAYHLFLAVKLLELMLFFLLLIHEKRLTRVLLVVLAMQAIWATLQVLLQHDLGFQILGEPVLNADAANIARFTWGSFELIRGYGTFPHPNVLGGFLGLGILLTFLSTELSIKEKKLFFAILGMGLLVSFSRSALLALMVTILLSGLEKPYFQSQKKRVLALSGLVLTLLLFFIMRGFNFLEDPAFLERIESYKSAMEMLKIHPFGVGFTQYTLFLNSIPGATWMPWEYQPVHNAYLLLLTELGWLFTAVFFAGIAYLSFFPFKKNPEAILILLILIISFFDHYWLSLEQGRLLFVYALAFMTAGSSSRTAADLR